MSLELRSDIIELKSVISVLKDITTDINIKFDESCLRMVALSNCKCIFVDCELYEKKFHRYLAHNKQISINLIVFNKLLNTISKNDILSIKKFKTKLSIRGTNKELTRKKYHSMPLQICDNNIEKTVPPDKIKGYVDNNYWKAEVIMDSKEFVYLLNYIKNSSEYVDIECSNNYIKFTSGDDINSKQTYTYERGEDINITYRSDLKKLVNSYDIGAIDTAKKLASLCETIEIYINDMLKIKYNFNLGYFSEYIPPRTKESDVDIYNDYYSDSDDEI